MPAHSRREKEGDGLRIWLKRAAYYWGVRYRVLLSTPAMLRLGARVRLWHPVRSGESYDDMLTALPGGPEEFARIEEFVFLPRKLHRALCTLEQILPKLENPVARVVLRGARNAMRIRYGLKAIPN